MEDVEPIEALDRAERRRRILVVGLGVALIVALGAYLFVPRTVASGEVDGQTWRLRIAPVAFGPEVTLTGVPADGVERASAGRRSGGLDETVVWRIGPGQDGEPGATVVVGPTPDGVASVRLSSDLGVGEARIVRIAWRRYHVDRLPGGVDVDQLVAIDAGGRPIEVSDLSGAGLDQ